MTEFLYQKFELFDRSPIESFNPEPGAIRGHAEREDHRELVLEVAGRVLAQALAQLLREVGEGQRQRRVLVHLGAALLAALHGSLVRGRVERFDWRAIE